MAEVAEVGRWWSGNWRNQDMISDEGGGDDRSPSHAMRGRAPEYKRRERESEGIRKRRDPSDAPRPETKKEPPDTKE